MERILGKLVKRLLSAMGMRAFIVFADGKVTPDEARELAVALFSVVADVVNDEYAARNPSDGVPPVQVPSVDFLKQIGKHF